MRKQMSMLAALVVGCLALPAEGSASGPTKYTMYNHVSGTHSNTPISGKGGTRTTVLVPSATAQGILTGITGMEKADKPKGFDFEFRQLSVKSSDSPEPEWYDLARTTRNVTIDNVTGLGDKKSVAVPVQEVGIHGYPIGTPIWAVHGIQVCMNNKETRIKGVRLYLSRFGRLHPQLERTNETRAYTRPNCKKWKQVRKCPAGKVATGIHVEHNDQHGATGMALRCTKVRLDTFETSIAKWQEANGPAQPTIGQPSQIESGTIQKKTTIKRK